MNIPLLNNGAELCIEALYMQESNENMVRRCVSRYTRPDTFYGIMDWVIFRLENAVKSFLGKSDWQITQKVIQNHVFKFAVEKIGIKKNINIANPENDIERLLTETVIEMTNTYVNRFFPAFVELNQKQIKISTELKKKNPRPRSNDFFK